MWWKVALTVLQLGADGLEQAQEREARQDRNRMIAIGAAAVAATAAAGAVIYSLSGDEDEAGAMPVARTAPSAEPAVDTWWPWPFE